MTMSFSTLFGR